MLQVHLMATPVTTEACMLRLHQSVHTYVVSQCKSHLPDRIVDRRPYVCCHKNDVLRPSEPTATTRVFTSSALSTPAVTAAPETAPPADATAATPPEQTAAATEASVVTVSAQPSSPDAAGAPDASPVAAGAPDAAPDAAGAPDAAPDAAGAPDAAPNAAGAPDAAPDAADVPDTAPDAAGAPDAAPDAADVPDAAPDTAGAPDAAPDAAGAPDAAFGVEVPLIGTRIRSSGGGQTEATAIEEYDYLDEEAGPECGFSGTLGMRIFGGSEVIPHTWPWIAVLGYGFGTYTYVVMVLAGVGYGFGTYAAYEADLELCSRSASHQTVNMLNEQSGCNQPCSANVVPCSQACGKKRSVVESHEVTLTLLERPIIATRTMRTVEKEKARQYTHQCFGLLTKRFSTTQTRMSQTDARFPPQDY